jgi:hypothetical protein
LEDCAITQLQQPEVTEMAEQVAQLAERQLPGRRPSRGFILRALRRDDQHSDDPRPDAGQPPAGIGRSLDKSLRRPGGDGTSRVGSLNATDSARRQHPKQTIYTLQAVISAAVVVGVFAFAVPKIASYGSAWAVVQQLTWTEVGLLLIVAAFNLVTYWPRAMAALPGLGFWQAAVRYQTTISVTYTVPAGGVAAVGLSYAMLRSWGFSLAEITLAELLDGIWDVFAKLAMPLAAVALLAATGSHKLSLLVPALIGLAVLATAVAGFGLLMWRKAYARWLGETLGTAVSWLRQLVHRPAVAGWGGDGGPVPAPVQRPGRPPLASAHHSHHREPSRALPSLPGHHPDRRRHPGAGQLGRDPGRLLPRPAAVRPDPRWNRRR